MGRGIVDPPDEMNFPPVNDSSEIAWQTTLQALAASNQALRDAIRKIDDAKLEEIVPEANYSIYALLHGVIQHDLYHAGQIALLKKACGL